MVDSLQDMCIYFMKTSEFSANYALAVEPGYIARQILISQADDLPVIFIHTRCTIVDGNFQRGVTCGFHVSRKSFLLGVFEGCVCQDPRALVQWHSEIKLKGMWCNAYRKHKINQKSPDCDDQQGFNGLGFQGYKFGSSFTRVYMLHTVDYKFVRRDCIGNLIN